MQTRREFIKNTGLLAGAVGMWGLLEGSIRRAGAIEPIPGSTVWDAEHVVVLMQENRSFDHCFGTLRGVRGFGDRRAMTLANGNPVWAQSNASGQSFLPFRLDIRESKATWMGSLPHSWQSQVDARNQGRHDRWLIAKRSGDKDYTDIPFTMGYYTRDDIPFYYQLADAFTVCDQHFCSALTCTTPNRLFLWTGTVRARPTPDAQANLDNSDADFDHLVRWTTFPERLEEAGVSWKIYQNELGVNTGLASEANAWLGNFEDNPIEYFEQFGVKFNKRHQDYLQNRESELLKEINSGNSAGKELDALRQELQSVRADREKWSAENFEKLTARAKRLHDLAFCTNEQDPDFRTMADIPSMGETRSAHVGVPKGDIFHQFRRDVESGQLPAVSWLVAPERLSDHPSSAWYGAWYISEAMNILTKNQDVWKKTVFILTYDENDGYFDHIPPFVAPRPGHPETGFASKGIDTALDYVELEQDRKRVPRVSPRQSPIGLGYRVPMIVASPWSRGGCVCSQVFDHTSVLQFLEKFLTRKTGHAVRETNITPWRRTISGDLTSIFQTAAKNGGPLKFLDRDAVVQEIHQARFKPLPSGYRALAPQDLDRLRKNAASVPGMPVQEPGSRPSCPLPYELYVDGALTSDAKRFGIRFEAARELFGEQSAGCPFIVHAVLGNGEMTVRNYAVSAGDQLQDFWNLADFQHGNYLLRVHGPNGFFREFSGNAAEPPLEIAVRGNVDVTVTNRAGRPLTVKIVDQAYGASNVRTELQTGATATLKLDTSRNFCWYDFIVTAEELKGFVHRYAGRVENGQWSFTEPTAG